MITITICRRNYKIQREGTIKGKGHRCNKNEIGLEGRKETEREREAAAREGEGIEAFGEAMAGPYIFSLIYASVQRIIGSASMIERLLEPNARLSWNQKAHRR